MARFPEEGTRAPGDAWWRLLWHWRWAVIGVALAAAISLAVGKWQGIGTRQGRWEDRPLEDLQVFWTVSDFSLLERSGRRVRLADLRGKVWIADFIYTKCTETCPLQTAYMAQLQRDLAAERDLRFVSITVDPKHDTPAVLRGYATRYGADAERWLFLTGDKRAIYELAQKGFRLAVVDPDDEVQGTSFWPFGPRPAYATHGSKGLMIHSSRLIVVDRQARVRGMYPGTEPDAVTRLRRDVKILLRER